MQIRTHPDDKFGQRLPLVRTAIEAAGISNAEGFVLLDDGEYEDESVFLDEFRDYAFYWNRSKPTDRAPSHVASLMSDARCTNLIWLSRRALSEEDIHLVWILAHEARHLIQATQTISTADLRGHIQRLRRKPQFSTLPGSTLLPLEVDSDLFALRVVGEIFGSSAVRSFLTRRNLSRCPDPRYLNFMEELKCTMLNDGSSRQ